MASGIIQLKRRSSGSAGAPANLRPGEVAVNEIDGIWYYGKGISSSDPFLASTIVAVGGAAKQDVNANLTSLAGFTSAADQVPYFNTSGALSLTGLTAFARTLLATATAAAARSSLSAAASGANSDITSLTGLTTAISIAQGGTGATSAAAARNSLGLGTMATQASSNVSITGGNISGVTFDSIDGGTF